MIAFNVKVMEFQASRSQVSEKLEKLGKKKKKNQSPFCSEIPLLISSGFCKLNSLETFLFGSRIARVYVM